MADFLESSCDLRVDDVRGYAPGLIAVPATDMLYTRAAQAIATVTHCAPPLSRFSFDMNNLSSIAAKRNFAVGAMLEDPTFKWLLQIDSDMIPPQTALMQLLARDRDAIGGLYQCRMPPHQANIGDPTFGPENGQGLLQVSFVGTGCLLVKRHVFEAIEPPWFDHTKVGLGEDAYFCAKAYAAGFKVFVDLALEVGHVTPNVVTPAWARAYQSLPEAVREQHMQELGLSCQPDALAVLEHRREEIAAALAASTPAPFEPSNTERDTAWSDVGVASSCAVPKG